VDTSANGLMAKTFQQIIGGKFNYFYWAHDDRLWDGTLPFSNYAANVATVLNGTQPGTPT